MKEIGGYFEFERLAGREYYPGLYKFNLARTAAAWFLKQRGCGRAFMPRFLCASVFEAVEDAGIPQEYYSIKEDFTPDETTLPDPGEFKDGDFLYVVNSYGLIPDGTLKQLSAKYKNVLVDNTHAFFRKPVEGIATLYSVRKFFGVPDGAYLYTEDALSMPEETDKSGGRFSHIFGRLEEDASTYYRVMLDNAESYVGERAKRMSITTQEILGAIDYESAKNKRTENFNYLHERLGRFNGLGDFVLAAADGAFCYPLLTDGGISVRKALAAKKIYVPTYWGNVINDTPLDSIEHRFASGILALPCDQRYGLEDMERVADEATSLLN